MDDHDLVQHEEAKRNRHLGPERHWQMIQEAITWIDENIVHRNTREACLRIERERRTGGESSPSE